MKKSLAGKPTLLTRLVQMLCDYSVVTLSIFLSYLARFDGHLPSFYEAQMLVVLPWLALLHVTVQTLKDGYLSLWRFTGLSDLRSLANAVAIEWTILTLVWLMFLRESSFRIPLGVILIFPIVSFVGLAGIRLGRRLQYRRDGREVGHDSDSKRILVVGAGSAGNLFLQKSNEAGFNVVGLIDDDPRMRGRSMMGIKVLGNTEEVKRVARECGVTDIVLCIPSAPKARLLELASTYRAFGLNTATVPSLADIMTGRATIDRVKAIGAEHLFVREARNSEPIVTFGTACEGKRVVVTGAGGSIGSELVRQVACLGPRTLCLIDQDENALFEVALELDETFPNHRTVIADIQDRAGVRRVFQEVRPEIVYHAAAYKHVPMMEVNPCEAIKNNVFGSRNVIEEAIRCGAESLVLISTDKAVNPKNVMGASKRAAERILQSHADSQCKTKLCAVRFGNVLDSRGSVVPLFRKWLSEGKHLKVTHPEAERYFMTISEAVELIIQAGVLGSHGEIFVLDMGGPVKILDLAERMIEMSGLQLHKDIKIDFTGLRPGEKISERLLTDCEENSLQTTEHPQIFAVGRVDQISAELLDDTLQLLEDSVNRGNEDRARHLLKDLCVRRYQDKI